MEKLSVENRKGQRITVVVEEGTGGLAFVMHGLGGTKEQPHIQTFVEAFRDKGFTVVYFDTTNTFGESDGDYENATVTNYYEDLEDVIGWATTQAWYQEPFWLAGHSLGGISTALYAQKYPSKVRAVAPISTVVSGQLSLEAHKRDNPEELANWEKTGSFTKESQSVPGRMKKLKWSHMIDRLKYDLVPRAHQLTMPVLLIVGEKDESTPPTDIKVLYDALPGPKEMHVLKGQPHTFRDPEALREIKNIFTAWIEKYS